MINSNDLTNFNLFLLSNKVLSSNMLQFIYQYLICYIDMICTCCACLNVFPKNDLMACSFSQSDSCLKFICTRCQQYHQYPNIFYPIMTQNNKQICAKCNEYIVKKILYS